MTVLQESVPRIYYSIAETLASKGVRDEINDEVIINWGDARAVLGRVFKVKLWNQTAVLEELVRYGLVVKVNKKLIRIDRGVLDGFGLSSEGKVDKVL